MCARRWPTDARRRLGSRKATTVLPEVPESTTPCRQVLTRSRRVAAGRGSRRDVPGIGPHRSSHPDQVDGRPAGCSFAHSLIRSFVRGSSDHRMAALQDAGSAADPYHGSAHVSSLPWPLLPSSTPPRIERVTAPRNRLRPPTGGAMGRTCARSRWPSCLRPRPPRRAF